MAKHRFVKPSPQPALGAKLGLTIQDIARSIKVDPKGLRQRAFDPDFRERARSLPIATVPDVVLGTVAAMMLVQSYEDWPPADAYLELLVLVHNIAAAADELSETRTDLKLIESYCEQLEKTSERLDGLLELQTRALKRTDKVLGLAIDIMKADDFIHRRIDLFAMGEEPLSLKGKTLLETYSIKESLDVLKLVRTVGIELGKATAKGGGGSALAALFESPEFKDQVKEAVKDIKLVPRELADIDVGESKELRREALSTAKAILIAFMAA